uniref:Membrane associated guanylate kinase, WW and PDZ domain containing 1 n=1 Tax=Eptatretus burgeri TaxID=7764 RepID=A0A8C4WYM6_EPTBU
MARALRRKAHWSGRVRETEVARGPDGTLPLELHGGAEFGRFILLDGNVLLEANGSAVPGFILHDAWALLQHCGDPIRLRTVKPGPVLSIDLKHYLSQRFQKGSTDHELQQTIRDNLYLRTVPCTTRRPREGEVSGLDYNFISVEEFHMLESSEHLLETGIYEDTQPKSNYCDLCFCFILSHNTKTTTWLDPRLKSHLKAVEECEEGGERGSDRVLLRVKLCVCACLCVPTCADTLFFTRETDELHGSFLYSHLRKGQRGFGFTIIGGDEPEEFLQIKSLITGGPAAAEGLMETGDVIVRVNDTCVLGYTHAQVVEIFKGVPIGEEITLALCRGYPLPFDPDDPNTQLVKSVAISLSGVTCTCTSQKRCSNCLFMKEVTCWQGNDPLTSAITSQPELITVHVTKGPGGFGFSIADGAAGQRVRQVQDGQRCRGLRAGDLLLELNRDSLRGLNHIQVVQKLKDFPPLQQATFLVQRGGYVWGREVGFRWSSLMGLGFECKLLKYEQHFYLQRQERGFGFRILGGNELGEPITIGSIVPHGAADTDGRLRQHDELLTVDDVSVRGQGHTHVLGLMQQAAKKGGVSLGIRRYLVMGSNVETSLLPPGVQPHKVNLQRNENEGFGFVLISTLGNDVPHRIDRIVPGSPAARSGHLKEGDRILAVNGHSIVHLSHDQIVSLIKTEGRNVTLSIVPAEGKSKTTIKRHGWASQKHVISCLQMQSASYSRVDLEKGSSGFGLKLDGGKDHGRDLSIVSLAPDSPALHSGRIQIGDYIVEINGESTRDMTYDKAIETIKSCGRRVHLLLKRPPGRALEHGK